MRSHGVLHGARPGRRTAAGREGGDRSAPRAPSGSTVAPAGRYLARGADGGATGGRNVAAAGSGSGRRLTAITVVGLGLALGGSSAAQAQGEPVGGAGAAYFLA